MTEKENKNTKIIMNVLFILTLACIFFGLITSSILSYNKIDFTSTSWAFWLWLPVPILSIFLGYKYKKNGLKVKKNIISGYIIGILLLIYGSFWLMFPSSTSSYNILYKYKNIISDNLPKKGDLQIVDLNSSNSEISKYTLYVATYKKYDAKDFYNSVKKSDNWVLDSELKSNLKIFIPVNIIQKSSSKVYYSIYNKTLDEYNKLPVNSGDYQIFTMIYDSSKNILEVHKFMYKYK